MVENTPEELPVTSKGNTRSIRRVLHSCVKTTVACIFNKDGTYPQGEREYVQSTAMLFHFAL